MNLVMYRMEDTERVRFKLRERRRQEIREKAAKEEEVEKKQMERIERNRKWRDRKLGKESTIGDEDSKVTDEREERKMKNKEWREKRENSKDSGFNSDKKVTPSTSLEMQLLLELECPYCQAEMCPPTRIYQCAEGHNLCQSCRENRRMEVSMT